MTIAASLRSLRLISFAALIGLLPFSASAALDPLTKADRSAIQTVISSQLKALETDDSNTAFALAAPEVRKHFGSADTFIAMVREGYPALFRNQSTAFLEAAIVEDDVIQPLRIIQRDGVVVIALFNMERQSNGDWRIYGCQIAPSDLIAA